MLTFMSAPLRVALFHFLLESPPQCYWHKGQDGQQTCNNHRLYGQTTCRYGELIKGSPSSDEEEGGWGNTKEGTPEKWLDPHSNNGRGKIDEPIGKEWCDSQEHDVPQHILVVPCYLCFPCLYPVWYVVLDDTVPNHGREEITECGSKSRTHTNHK